MSTFVTRTPLTSMRPLGSDGERSYTRVTSIIAREVSPEHARLLGEPVPVRDGSAVDWYVEDDEGELIALAALDSAEADALRRRLANEMTGVLDRAEAIEQTSGGGEGASGVAAVLRSAMTFPGEDSIWALKTEDGLRPVIVAWGYAPHDAGTGTPFNVSTFAPKRLAKERVDAVANGEEQSAVAAATGPAVSAGAVGGGGWINRRRGHSSGGRFGWLGWLLGLLVFLLLLLLILLIAAYLLPACGLRTPFGTVNFGLPGRMGCGQSLQSQVIAADLESLNRELRVLQGEYTRRRLICASLEERIPEQDTSEFSDRIENRGETQVTLIWNTRDDLDLHLSCPNNSKINYNHKAGCGGRLDVDANADNIIRAPVENITFGPDMDPGKYHIFVNLYRSRAHRYPVPFKLRIRDNQGERVVDGMLRSEKETVSIADFVN